MARELRGREIAARAQPSFSSRAELRTAASRPFEQSSSWELGAGRIHRVEDPARRRIRGLGICARALGPFGVRWLVNVTEAGTLQVAP